MNNTKLIRLLADKGRMDYNVSEQVCAGTTSRHPKDGSVLRRGSTSPGACLKIGSRNEFMLDLCSAALLLRKGR